jgi:hypothetical protein
MYSNPNLGKKWSTFSLKKCSPQLSTHSQVFAAIVSATIIIAFMVARVLTKKGREVSSGGVAASN